MPFTERSNLLCMWWYIQVLKIKHLERCPMVKAPLRIFLTIFSFGMSLTGFKITSRVELLDRGHMNSPMRLWKKAIFLHRKLISHSFWNATVGSPPFCHSLVNAHPQCSYGSGSFLRKPGKSGSCIGLVSNEAYWEKANESGHLELIELTQQEVKINQMSTSERRC